MTPKYTKKQLLQVLEYDILASDSDGNFTYRHDPTSYLNIIAYCELYKIVSREEQEKTAKKQWKVWQKHTAKRVKQREENKAKYKPSNKAVKFIEV